MLLLGSLMGGLHDWFALMWVALMLVCTDDWFTLMLVCNDVALMIGLHRLLVCIDDWFALMLVCIDDWFALMLVCIDGRREEGRRRRGG